MFCNCIFLGGGHGFYADVIAKANGAWQEAIRKAVNRIASGFAFAMTNLYYAIIVPSGTIYWKIAVSVTGCP
jgi:hypothetical protein